MIEVIFDTIMYLIVQPELEEYWLLYLVMMIFILFACLMVRKRKYKNN